MGTTETLHKKACKINWIRNFIVSSKALYDYLFNITGSDRVLYSS